MCRECLVTWQVCDFEGRDFAAELGQDFEKAMTNSARLIDCASSNSSVLQATYRATETLDRDTHERGVP